MSYLKDNDTAFSKKLTRGSAAIKKAAGGNTCGNCISSIFNKGATGFCAAVENYEGNNLRIYRETAYACSRFQARR